MLVRESINESIKHLKPRSGEELQELYLKELETAGFPVSKAGNDPDYIKIEKLFKVPKKDLYILSEFDSNRYEMLSEFFRSLIKDDKPVKIKVKETDEYYSGTWLCYPKKMIAQWTHEEMTDAPNGWLFNKSYILNKYMNK